MVDLPAELWGTIASYLNKRDLQNLLTLSSAFLHAYLSEKYSSVTINYSSENVAMMESLEVLAHRLLDTYVNSRIHTLVIYPTIDGLLESSRPSQLKEKHPSYQVLTSSFGRKMLAKYSKKTLRVRNDQSIENDPPLLPEVILTAIQKIPPSNITTLDLRCAKVPPPSGEKFCPFLALAWITFTPFIVELRLEITLLANHRLDSNLLSGGAMQCLKTLEVVCHDKLFDSSVEDAIADGCTHFFRSLQGIPLSIDHLIFRDASKHFSSILGPKNDPHFDKLKTFRIDGTADVALEDAVNAFSSRHWRSLQSFEIAASLPLYRIDPTLLRVLRIRSGALLQDWDYLYPHLSIPRNCSRLTHLHIIPGSRRLSNTKALALITGVAHSAPLLQTLELSILKLGSDLIVCIARYLPHLRKLILHPAFLQEGFTSYSLPACVLTDDNGKTVDIVTFRQELSEPQNATILLQWQLKDLAIKQTPCCTELLVIAPLKAIARFVPSISSFDGYLTLVPSDGNCCPQGEYYLKMKELGVS
ncbi:hypothetical protein DL96DRAFT_1818591 [Flagelloscypha sp. PMI_526]|nr:hypothetical protein DL96DRAFT_1818591 [Flagelloscypha sp. PMI_526]